MRRMMSVIITIWEWLFIDFESLRLFISRGRLSLSKQTIPLNS